MKKKPDPQQALRDAQRREIIEKRKQVQEKPQAPSVNQAKENNGKPSPPKKVSKQEQRREIIEKRKQQGTQTPFPPQEPIPPVSPPPEEVQPEPESPPARTLSKAPPGDFPLPKGFVMPPKPPPDPADDKPPEEPTPSVPPAPPPVPPPAKPSMERKTPTGQREKIPVSKGLPTFASFFPNSDESQLKQYKMLSIMLGIACFFGLSFTLFQVLLWEDDQIEAVLYLDVNPSIALYLNSNNTIMDATPQNAQGATVLSMGPVQGKSLESGLELLMGLLNVYGYLEDNATLLATLETKDQISGEEQSIAIKQTLDSLLMTVNPKVTTVGLWADPSYEFALSAEENGISYGKRVLIEELSKEDFFFSLENLMDYSNKELFQIYASGSATFPIGLASAMDLGKQALLLSDFDPFVVSIASNLMSETPSYEAFFQTSTHEYRVEVHGYTGEILNILERQVGNTGFSLGLTQTQAKDTALSSVQKLELQVEQLSVKEDWSKGRLQYLVTFQEEDVQVNILLLASTGEILSSSLSEIDENAITDLGQNSIQDIAFADAGVKRSELSGTTFQRSQIDGVMVYELSFWAGNREYYYQISGTGLIVQSSFMDYGEPEPDENQAETTETQAKNIALDHAGATFSQVTGLVVGRDMDGHFIIEFTLSNTPYSYEISATTGEIISYEKKEAAPEEAVSSTDIGGEEAKLIALQEENLKEVMLQSIDLTFEGMGAEKEYHIAFEFSSFEYYYIVKASSGEILHREKQALQALLPDPVEEETPELVEENLWQQTQDFNDLFVEFDNNFNNFWS